jgi:hypothetical protein
MNRVMNIPERSLELASAFRQKWFWMWVLLPIVAYYASWLLMTLPFPIFLVIAQWMALNRNKRKEKPSWWFWNLVNLMVTAATVFLIDSTLPIKGIFVTMLSFSVYYSLQILNEYVLSKVFINWRWGYWSGANVAAALFWIGMFGIGWKLTDNQVKYEYVIWGIIPVLGLLSNIITGLGIHLATQSRYGV